MRLRSLAAVTSVILVAFSTYLPRTLSTRTRWVEPHTGMKFVLLPAGDFEMGSPANEFGHEAKEALHRVRISVPFYLGQYEVTLAEWLSVMGKNPSEFATCTNCPVERVTWYSVRDFITRLNRLSGFNFRLPTEAEWEYSCRAGTTTPFNTGSSISSSQANFDGRFPYHNSRSSSYHAKTAPVGSYPPNAWGLYDMHGNVWEWTSDSYCDYPLASVTDPKSSCKSEYKVIRGGSWYFDANSCRCALRYTHRPSDSGFSLGFRIARSIH